MKRGPGSVEAETLRPTSQPSLAARRPDHAEHGLWHDVLAPPTEANYVVDPAHLAYEQAATHPSASDLTYMTEDDLMVATLLANSFAPAGEGGMPHSAHEDDSETRSASLNHLDETVCPTPRPQETTPAPSDGTANGVSEVVDNDDAITEELQPSDWTTAVMA